ncbi:MAG: hypothetical protein R2780_14290 [Crocinitomicaceae bacterium]|nr:hypothetical protein [Crocinitomicaceae bacterium]
MKTNNPLEDIQEIRRMMEGSSKFISLSGLSGIFAGLVALTGAAIAYLKIENFNKMALHYYASGNLERKYFNLDLTLIAIAACVLIIAFAGGVFFTGIKAKKNGQSIWSPIAYRLLRSFLLPLGFGGLFVIGLYYNNTFHIIAPAMLILYGMALLNASKYLTVDIKYLALCEMSLGVILTFIPGYGLWFWAFGFGVLHIVYGAIMYYKYDYKKG